RRVLLQPRGGVVGLVDDLLLVCQERGLEVDWQADRCCVRSFSGESEDLIEVVLRKSVFRAILARVAALCNERHPGSLSPYGGQGELSMKSSPEVVFRVTLV